MGINLCRHVFSTRLCSGAIHLPIIGGVAKATDVLAATRLVLCQSHRCCVVEMEGTFGTSNFKWEHAKGYQHFGRYAAGICQRLPMLHSSLNVGRKPKALEYQVRSTETGTTIPAPQTHTSRCTTSSYSGS